MRPAKKAAIVLLHGWACDKTVWNRVRSRLESDFETFASDARGFGEREEELQDSNAWSLDLAAEEIGECAQAVRPKSVLVVGASMGGEIALLAAARQVPMSGLVVIGASPKHLRGDGYPFGMERSAAEGLVALLRSGYADAIRNLAPAVLLTEEDREVVDRGLQVLAAIAGRVRDPEKPIRILEKIHAGLDLRESLGEISVPVLLLHGDRDAVAPPAVGRFLEERIPQATLEVIPGAGHLVHLTAPGKVAEAIARFASSISL